MTRTGEIVVDVGGNVRFEGERVSRIRPVVVVGGLADAVADEVGIDAKAVLPPLGAVRQELECAVAVWRGRQRDVEWEALFDGRLQKGVVDVGDREMHELERLRSLERQRPAEAAAAGHLHQLGSQPFRHERVGEVDDGLVEHNRQRVHHCAGVRVCYV